jgi:hypothetical protein
MRAVDTRESPAGDLAPEKILAQVELMAQDDVFRSSKRSVAFLRYVVNAALNGPVDQIKERTIGVEVFGRLSSYDTSLDHIVRTAATELRKRLAIYYGDEKHRSELRIGLTPGSYVPRFTPPHQSAYNGMDIDGVTDHPSLLDGQSLLTPTPSVVPDTEAAEIHLAQRKVHWGRSLLACVLCIATIAASAFIFRSLRPATPEHDFWKPVLDTPGPVLLAVGDVPNGPPKLAGASENGALSPVPSSDSSQTVPFSDAVTIARVVGSLEANQKKVLIRRESSSSFSDLRQGPVVLIGAFNNEWSLRLTHSLRYSLALDPEQHLIYIKDARNPSARNWSWGTNQPRDHVSGINSPKLRDYALISRIQSSDTGHVVVVIGGLYRYGTEAAGEFLTDPNLLRSIARQTGRIGGTGTLQIVLGATVTDETPGPPQILAVSTE